MKGKGLVTDAQSGKSMSLNELIAEMREKDLAIMAGEEVDPIYMEFLDGELHDKMDAAAYRVDEIDADIERYKKQIKRLQAEIKLFEKAKERKKSWLAHCLGMLGISQIKTRYHRFFVRDSNPKATYDENDKAFETIDDRCVVTETKVTRRVSKTAAIDLWKESDPDERKRVAPKGFTITRGLTLTIK